MAVYEVFSHPLRIRYKATVCSKTTLFHIVTTTLTVLMPVFFIYTEDFWRKVETYREQPDISFKHKMLILLETKNPEELIFWSTYASLNEQIIKKFQQLIPSVEHREEDYNKDGKKDELQMTIDIPVLKQEIISVKLILIFDFKLHMYSNLHMESAAFIQHSSALPGSSFHLVSELSMVQKEPLNLRVKDERYNIPVIDDSRENLTKIKLENVFLHYLQRNVTTVLSNIYPVWETGRAAYETFKLNLVIMYPEQTIIYKVGLWQLLKWAVIQYMAFYVLFAYIFYRLKIYVFQKQLFPSIVLSPIKQHV